MQERDPDIETLERIALEELAVSPKPAAGIALAFNKEARPVPATEADTATHIDAEDAQLVLDELVDEGDVEPLADRDGWYKLAGWEDMPVRVNMVSHHLIRIVSVDEMHALWLEESTRAARHEHDVDEQSLHASHIPEMQSLQLSFRNFDVLEQYRETLSKLADGVADLNPEKEQLYEGLADATDIESEHDSHEREIPLLEG